LKYYVAVNVAANIYCSFGKPERKGDDLDNDWFCRLISWDNPKGVCVRHEFLSSKHFEKQKL
jgi:hypothetical protein